MSRRRDHLRLVSEFGRITPPPLSAYDLERIAELCAEPAPAPVVDVDAPLTPMQLAELDRRLDAIIAEAPPPRGFAIGSLCRVAPWQLPTWRPFEGVVWFQRPQLLDRLQEAFRGR